MTRRFAVWVGIAFAMAGLTYAQESEILIRNGLIMAEKGRMTGDLRIRGGVIVEFGANLKPGPDAKVYDATGKLVLPGGVDPHVHLTPVPTPTMDKGSDDYTTASLSAFAGGKTTIGNFITQIPGESATKTLTDAFAVLKKQAMADVVLHFTVQDPKEFTPWDTAMLYDKQVTLKVFLNRPTFEENSAAFVNLIRGAGTAGLLTMVHCEDAALTGTTRQRMTLDGRGSLKGQNYPDSAPLAAEEFATQRAVAISEATGAPLYIVHMSSKPAMQAAEEGRKRGLPIFTEVRFIYLHLTKERFDQADGQIYTGSPPLRDKESAEYLWQSIANGSGDVVDTDHVGHTKAEKLDPTNSILKSRAAANYLQEQMPLLYSEGVRKGRITLEQFVALESTNPAKLFGLYPKKGVIALGSDADVAIWDPNLTHTIKDEDVLSNGHFSIYSGWEVTGWPIVTIRRGEVVFENGKVLSKPGSGKLAERHHWMKP